MELFEADTVVALCGCHGVVYMGWHVVTEKRSSGHKSSYDNSEFSVSMSIIDLARVHANTGQICRTSDGF